MLLKTLGKSLCSALLFARIGVHARGRRVLDHRGRIFGHLRADTFRRRRAAGKRSISPLICFILFASCSFTSLLPNKLGGIGVLYVEVL